MLSSMRSLAVWFALPLAALALAACGGGSDEPSVQQPATAPAAFVSAAEAMGASAENFRADVHSFEGTMSVKMTGAGESFNVTGEMKYSDPATYMNMKMPGLGGMEMFVVPPDMYFGHDGTWYTFDSSSLGIDLGALQKYAEDKGPVSYSDVLQGMQGLQQLPDEQIDGAAYWHYQGSLDPSKLADEIPSDIIDPDLLGQAADALQDTSMDIFIDPQTLLPRRYTMTMTMDISGEPMTMDMTMDFESYNTDVDMPDVPTDAEPFSLPDL